MEEDLWQQFERIEARIQYHLARVRQRAREMQLLIQGNDSRGPPQLSAEN